MLSFASSLRPDTEGFAIFVTEKYEYKNTVLSKNVAQKIDSFIKILKVRNKEEEISSFDISDKQKCFVVKVKNKYAIPISPLNWVYDHAKPKVAHANNASTNKSAFMILYQGCASAETSTLKKNQNQ